MRARAYQLLRQFRRSEAGSSTIEFVIIFPMIVALLLLIVFASLLIATMSDVQALSHDLARTALRYGDSATAQVMCDKLRTVELTEALKRVVSSIDPAKLTLTCILERDAPMLGVSHAKVQVTYNLAGDAIARMGSELGLNLGQVQRHASSYF